MTENRRCGRWWVPLTAILLGSLAQPAGAAAARPRAFIAGTIVDVGGNPVAGAKVYVYESANVRRPPEFMSGASDAAGRFRVAVNAGRAWVVARVRAGAPVGPLMPGDRHSGPPRVLEVDAGTTETVELVVADLMESARRNRKTSRDVVRVAGRLENAEGTPCLGSYVLAWRAGSRSRYPEFLSPDVDARGRFHLYMPPGRYELAVSSAFPPPEGSARLRVLDVRAGTEALDLEVACGIRNEEADVH